MRVRELKSFLGRISPAGLVGFVLNVGQKGLEKLGFKRFKRMSARAYRRRIITLFIVVFIAFILLEVRLVFLQIVDHPYYVKLGEVQRKKLITIAPKRGNIVDRNGNALAITVFLNSVNLDPGNIEEQYKPTVAQELSKILNLKYDTVADIIKKGKPTTLARKISQEQTRSIQQLIDRIEDETKKNKSDKKLIRNAIYFAQEGKRTYPKGEFASHILGYTTFDDYGDNKGLAGIEIEYNQAISGSVERAQALQDAIRKSLVPINSDTYSSAFGNDVYLTIDEAIQHSAEMHLKETVDEQRAASGVCIVMDCNTGEILALANYPTYDPNKFTTYPDFLRKNKAIQDTFEPGSVMKVFTAAVLLDEGAITPTDIIDCQMGHAYINKTKIHDVHKMGAATFTEIIAESSNIGTVKASMRLPPEEICKGLQRFGFGRGTDVDLPGESPGILRPFSKWTEHSASAVPIGQEIGVTGLQISAGCAAVANGGLLLKPYIVKSIVSPKGEVVKEFEPSVVRRVINTETAKTLTKILEEVVINGTGKMARVDGYRAAGKTGTAQKFDIEAGEYSKKDYVSSFVGFIPSDDPKVVIYAYVDEPRVAHFGGTVASPIFSKVGEDCMRILGVPRSEPLEKPEEKPLLVLEKPIQKETDYNMNVASQVLANGTSTMPDLTGLTMREAIEKVSPLDLNVRMSGSGFVVKQTPTAGSIIPENKWCKIEFAREL